MTEAEKSTPPATLPFNLTDKAIEMVKVAMRHEGLPDYGLRVGVIGGGCSGFQYELGFEEKPKAGDSIFELGGIRIFVDETSQRHLSGVKIDYIDALHGAGFKFLNPNAARTCGCGSSFSP